MEHVPCPPWRLRAAFHAQLDRARTSRAVSSLAAKGLLQRSVGRGDRRYSTLSLTAEGRALHAESFPLVAEINRELVSVLPDPLAGVFGEARNASYSKPRP